ncbi:MAG: hypothetical protein LUI02_03390 [Clostridiales bacterium]|nr:hypothetical protein [Clostridiales bacterium]
MIRTEIKRNLSSIWFLVGIALMYALFMVGDSGNVLPDGSATTVISAIWNKLHGNWAAGSFTTSSLLQIDDVWTCSRYFPALAPLFCSLPAILHYRDEEGLA